VAFDPPTIQNAKARHAVQRGFHTTGSRSFLRSERRIKPNVDSGTDQLSQRHIVVFQINNPNIVRQRRRCFENPPNNRFAAFVSWVGLAGVDQLQRAPSVRYLL
jgi:hypothetical protein